MITGQLEKDLMYTYEKLSEEEIKRIMNSSIVITGCAGFIGYYLVHFLYYYKEKLKLKRVICLDNFMLGHPKWLEEIEEDPCFDVRKFDIISDDIESIPKAEKADYIIHMASIASPIFYRKYPIQTLEANIWGLRRLLECYKDKRIKGFLFFSSSEIYGNPVPEAVPTAEDYFGNVSCIGPRACYDESKRFGETICMLFAKEYNLPIGVARPFNNYGPGMKINDQRVTADFMKNIIEGSDLQILSNGSPSRTFCYIADAVAGYLKILLHGAYDYFNIGICEPEITVSQLAEIFKEQGRQIFGYQGRVVYHVSEDRDYLTNNPQRRCPNISKAEQVLNYKPSIYVEEGIMRYMRFIKENLADDGGEDRRIEG